MFGFRKKDSPAAEAPERAGLFERLRQGLAKTGKVLSTDIGELFRRRIDDELFEELEERLLLADVGVDATRRIMDQITRAVKRGELDDAKALMQALERAMTEVLAPVERPLRIQPGSGKPFSILVVGITAQSAQRGQGAGVIPIPAAFPEPGISAWICPRRSGLSKSTSPTAPRTICPFRSTTQVVGTTRACHACETEPSRSSSIGKAGSTGSVCRKS
jgi:hypothetical protein